MRTRRRRDTDAALQAALDGRDPDDPKVCAIQPIVDVVRASIGAPPDPDGELAAVLEEGLDAGADAAASASEAADAAPPGPDASAPPADKPKHPLADGESRAGEPATRADFGRPGEQRIVRVDNRRVGGRGRGDLCDVAGVPGDQLALGRLSGRHCDVTDPDRLVRVGQLGDPGTAVLAGHVDSRTQGRGVFCDLVTLEVGDEILFDTVDGPQTWIVTETTSYDRQELPIEELFSLDGDPNWRMHPPHIAQTPVRPPCCPWMPSCGVSHFLSRGWGEVSAG